MRSLCAQRLSASLIGSPSCHPESSSSASSAQRLSASLIGSPLSKFSVSVLKNCAQRLSASLIGSRPPSATCSPAQSSAQRLSASLIGSQEHDAHRLVVVWVVLNAFRHHCSYHQPPARQIREDGSCAQLLSASLI